MMRRALSASGVFNVQGHLRSRALAGVACPGVIGKPLPWSTHDACITTSESCLGDQATEGSVPAVPVRRGRCNDLRGWPSLVRNFSSNAPSANADGAPGRKQQLGQRGVHYDGVSASTVDAGQDPLIGSDEDMGIDANNTVVAPSARADMTTAQPPHTVVEHPPAPGWEYPPVPDGCEPKFAIIRLGNTQHKVTKDDIIVAEKLPGDIGTTLEVTDVLLVGTPEDTVVGRPIVSGASVKLFIEEQTLDKKVIVFKKRRRKASKTTQGHRRHITILRVTDILH